MIWEAKKRRWSRPRLITLEPLLQFRRRVQFPFHVCSGTHGFSHAHATDEENLEDSKSIHLPLSAHLTDRPDPLKLTTRKQAIPHEKDDLHNNDGS